VVPTCSSTQRSRSRVITTATTLNDYALLDERSLLDGDADVLEHPRQPL
jgi:hypothetical protein